MNYSQQILATVYDNGEKVCDCYFQTIPRKGESVIISDVFDTKYLVNSVEHTTFPIASTSTNSYNMNRDRISRVHVLCSKIS